MHDKRELLEIIRKDVETLQDMLDQSDPKAEDQDVMKSAEAQQPAKDEEDDKKPDEFLRAFYTHEGDLVYQFTKTWKLPRPLPANLPGALSFLREREGTKYWWLEIGTEKAFYWNKNLNSQQLFDKIATDAFGPTVVGACGIIHTIIVPES